jgi:hypothetical protein
MMDTRKVLTNFISKMGSMAPPMFTTIADEGIVFKSQPLTDSEIEDMELLVDYTSKICNFQQKECFHNAQMLVHTEDSVSSDLSNEIKYFEGYFIRESLLIPIHHGWVTINGKVIDLTIRQDSVESPLDGFEDRTLGEFADDVGYIGIEIDKQDVVDRIDLESETHTILDDWNPKYRHIRDKYLKGRSNPKLQSFEQRLQAENSTLSSDSPIWFRGAKGHGEKGLGLGAMGLGLYLTRNPNVAEIYAKYSKGMVLKYFVNMDIEVLDTESPQYFDCLQFAVNEARLNPKMTQFLQELIQDKDFIGFYNKYYQVLSGYEPFENALSECIKSLGYRGVYSHDENFGLVLFYPEQDSIPFFKII